MISDMDMFYDVLCANRVEENDHMRKLKELTNTSVESLAEMAATSGVMGWQQW